MDIRNTGFDNQEDRRIEEWKCTGGGNNFSREQVSTSYDKTVDWREFTIWNMFRLIAILLHMKK